MGRLGRWEAVALTLGAVLVAAGARAGDGGPLLVFDSSAAALPQAEVHDAIERELGKPLAATDSGPGARLTVLVDADHRLVVRYETATGGMERYLPMPNEPSDIALIIALAAGNLVRDPTIGVGPPPAPAAPPPHSPASPPVALLIPLAQPVAKPFPRHLFGVHVAQDIAFVGGSNVCDPHLGPTRDNYACFYEGSDDEPFFHTPFPYEDGIETGPVLATTRLLVSYEYAPSRFFSIGGRAGYAFRGGPPAGQTPVDGIDGDVNDVPPHAKGEGGTPFLPVHLEIRATGWFVPLGKPVSAYVAAGAGVAQVDAKTTLAERDCAQTLSPDWDDSNGDFADCTQGDSSFDWKALDETKVDAWKKMGQAFVAASIGAMFRIADQASVLANVNAMYFFPARGIVLEPSLGVVATLPSQ